MEQNKSGTITFALKDETPNTSNLATYGRYVRDRIDRESRLDELSITGESKLSLSVQSKSGYSYR